MNGAIYTFYILTLIFSAIAIYLPAIWILTATALITAIILTIKEKLKWYDIAQKISLTLCIFFFLCFLLNGKFPIWAIICTIIFGFIFLIFKAITYTKNEIAYAEERERKATEYQQQIQRRKSIQQKQWDEIPGQYEKKKLLTNCEMDYYKIIQEILPKEYILQPQICLASIININFGGAYNLFRITDFGIFDTDGNIKMLIEINDKSHYEPHRIKRDREVNEICKQAKIPLVTFWTTYAIDRNYIAKRIYEYL